MRCFKIIFIFTFFLGIALLRAEPQFTIGSIIRGFELPQTDENGKLKSKIRGDEALVLSDNQIRITDLEIELYNKNGQRDVLIKSPQSVFWRLQNKLTTDKTIQVKYPGMVVTSDTMEWELGKSKGAFRDNVRVVVTSTKKVLE